MGDYEDRADIIDVTHNYCWALDRNQWDELDDVFLPTATALLGTREAANRDEIKEICSSALGKLDLRAASRQVHDPHAIVVLNSALRSCLSCESIAASPNA